MYSAEVVAEAPFQCRGPWNEAHCTFGSETWKEARDGSARMNSHFQQRLEGLAVPFRWGYDRGKTKTAGVGEGVDHRGRYWKGACALSSCLKGVAGVAGCRPYGDPHMRAYHKDEHEISHNNPLPHCPHDHHHRSHPQERGGVWVEGVGVEVRQGGNQEDQSGLCQNQEGLAVGGHQGNEVANSHLSLEDRSHPHLAVGFWRSGHESFCLGNKENGLLQKHQ